MSCPRCGDLDFDALFANDQIPCQQYGFPVAEIEGLSRSCRRARCLVCRFLASSTSLMDTCIVADTWHLRAFDIDTIMMEQEQHKLIPLQRLVFVLVPGAGDEDLEFDINESDMIVPTTRITTPESTACAPGPVGRMLNQNQVSWHLLQTWLNTCIRDHNPRCAAKLSNAQLPEMNSVQVLDCRDGSIVPFDGSDFVALSYCIGPRKRKRRIGSITGKRTQYNVKVVTDAIECTKRLGYRYLWVDQVCIDQDDKAVLQDTISKMNLIYSQAAFTIASLAPTQNDGLPGVRHVLRQSQPLLQTEAATYVSTMHSLPVAVNKSKWISRAWCYQEALLSKRLLIFSAQQVYFMCNSSHLSEALTYSAESPSPALTGLRRPEYVADSTNDKAILSQDEVEWSFAAWIAAFTTRDISFQDDVLNAFRGILGISPYQSFWGVPFVIDNQARQGGTLQTSLVEAFARGLIWSTSYNSNQFVKFKEAPTDDHFYRRSEFPSWSWASCRTYNSPIRYQIPGGFAAEYVSDVCINNAVSSLEIEVERLSGDIVPMMEFVQAHHGTKMLPESSKYIYITTDTVNLRLCRVHVDSSDDASTCLVKFCIKLGGVNDAVASNSVSVESQVFEETPNELEDGRFIIDLDKPPATESNVSNLQHNEFLGIMLLQRAPKDGIDEDDGEYCVMLVRRSSDAKYWVRFGVVWIAADHMKMLCKQRKRIRLG